MIKDFTTPLFFILLASEEGVQVYNMPYAIVKQKDGSEFLPSLKPSQFPLFFGRGSKGKPILFS